MGMGMETETETGTGTGMGMGMGMGMETGTGMGMEMGMGVGMRMGTTRVGMETGMGIVGIQGFQSERQHPSRPMSRHKPRPSMKSHLQIVHELLCVCICVRQYLKMWSMHSNE